jgi:hypothetical protein
MKFSLRYRPEVVSDLDEASKWYDERKSGLGAEFLQECKSALDRIKQRPEQVAADTEGLRSMRISRFPYVIHYRIEGQTLVIFGIMFGGRGPSEWHDRV